LLLFVRVRVDHDEGNARAVGRPAEGADIAAYLAQLLRLTTICGDQEDARFLVLVVTSREERQPLAVGRPLGFGRPRQPSGERERLLPIAGEPYLGGGSFLLCGCPGNGERDGQAVWRDAR